MSGRVHTSPAKHGFVDPPLIVERLIAYKADSGADRIGGLLFEVKGDFCHKVGILERQSRAVDYSRIITPG